MAKVKWTAILLCVFMIAPIFCACDGNTSQGKNQGGVENVVDTGAFVPGGETELTYLINTEIADWNYLTTASDTPAMYIDSLVEYDYLGICQPCLAQSWERSEDGLIWTFHIRQGVQWMTYDQREYAETTAQDWVTSAEYVLNAANGSRLSDMLFMIQGAEAYYDATAQGLPADFSTVGVKALDRYTLQYTLNAPLTYFLSSLTYKCFFPANAQFMQECGDMFSTDNQTMLYNGEFIMTEYEPQGRIVSILNPTYWDMEDMHITKITQIYNAEADTVAPEMFLRGEVNYAEIPSEQLTEWLNNPEKVKYIRPCRPSFYSFYYMFNFYPNFNEKYEPENWKIAVNNISFRKSIYYAFDKIAAIMTYDAYNAGAHVLNTITPADFISVDGVDYTQLDALKDLTDGDSYDPTKALAYKEQAIKELTASGCTFPIKIFMPYDSASAQQAARAQVIEQQWERDLGTEYIDVILEAYADTDFANNTMRSGNYCIMPSLWMADYLDPLSYTDPFTIVQNRTNFIYMADGYSKVSDTYVENSKQGKDGKYYYDIIYDSMVGAAANEYEDLSKRYNELAKCERWLIDQCLVMPYMRGGTGYIASSLLPFESQYAAFGASDGRYKYMYIYMQGIDTEEYYRQYEVWQQERAAKIAELDAQGLVAGVDY